MKNVNKNIERCTYMFILICSYSEPDTKCVEQHHMSMRKMANDQFSKIKLPSSP
jgi:hypothetical protein